MDNRAIAVRLPVEAEDLSLFRSAQTSSNVHKISSTLRTGDDSLGEKRPGREADKQTSSNANVKNEWSYTFVGPYALKACTGVNFTILNDVHLANVVYGNKLLFILRAIKKYTLQENLKGY